MRAPRLIFVLALPAAASLSLGAPARAEERRVEVQTDVRRWSAPQRTDSKHVRAVRRILAPARLRGRVLEEVADEVAALGPTAAPALFAMLSGTLEGPPEQCVDDAPRARPGALGRNLLREDVVLIAALGKLPSADVSACLATRAGGAAPLPLRMVALRVLGEVGAARAVEAWLAIASGIEPANLERGYVRTAFEAALTRALQRDPAGFACLEARVRRLERALAPLVVRAVAATERARGIGLLFALLGVDRDLDLALLPEIARLGERARGTLSDAELDWLRPFLRDEGWRVRQEAALALGRLCDVGSFTDLCAALTDEQRLVRQAAAWSLRAMSGQELGVEPERWLAWHESEIAWFQGPGARCLEALSSGEPALVVEALRELALRKLLRHESAAAMVALLSSPAPELAVAASRAIAQLGSMRAALPLAHALARPEEDVRRAAWEALRAMTKKKLPIAAPAWVAALGG